MAEKILIMGESGTGKSTSLRNFDPSELAVVNPVGKPLPFKGSNKFEMLNGETDSRKIIKFMNDVIKKGKKTIVVDDFQYILSVPYMNRIKEAGWDKWNDFGGNYFDIIDICKDLPKDVTVYYMTHTETLENGITTIKLIGKLLREKITIEGLFTTVLRTQVTDGKYYFLTQNSGKDTVKSPMDMFPSYAIENDLKYVDDKLRNYYEIGEFKSDKALQEADAAVASDLSKEDAGKQKTRRGRKTEESKSEEQQEASEEEPKKSTRRGKKAEGQPDFMNIPDTPEGVEETDFDETVPDPEPRKPRRGRRTKDEEPKGEMTGAKAAYDKAKEKQLAREAADLGEMDEVPTNPEPNTGETEPPKPARRQRRTRK